MIVHAARIGGTAILYSEDFQHGSVLGGIRILNPFKL
jgi:predicted nucleic acid-binding protein